MLYQLCLWMMWNAIARQFVEEFLLEDVKNYRYLTHGNVTVAGQDDAELYRQLVEAMDIMGFSKDEQDGMLSCLTGSIVVFAEKVV